MKPFAAPVLKHHTRIMPVVLPLVMVAATTAVLAALDVFLDTELLVFGYLVPTSLAAIAYGSPAGTFTAIVSTICAVYFVYPPTFVLWVEKPLHAIELGVFAVLALAASHIVGRMSDRSQD